jgi:hypothetical protein
VRVALTLLYAKSNTLEKSTSGSGLAKSVLLHLTPQSRARDPELNSRGLTVPRVALKRGQESGD